MRQSFTAISTIKSIDVRLIDSIIDMTHVTCISELPSTHYTYDVCLETANIVRVTPVLHYNSALRAHVTFTQVHKDTAIVYALRRIVDTYKRCTIEGNSVLVYLSSYKGMK